MKQSLVLLTLTVLLFGCQKSVDIEGNSSTLSQTVESNALAPLPCHTTSFATNYSAAPGQVPPFRFTKTLYSDTRVKTINMLSRAFPNHSAYKKHAYELIGTFSYTTNRAKFTGTRETWEYFKTATGAAGKRSLGKTPVTYYFTFNPNTGYCMRVGIANYTYNSSIVELLYDESGLRLENAFLGMGDGFDPDYFYFKHDSRGNITGTYHVYSTKQNILSYSYDYTKSGGRYNYQPSQYAICQEYSLLEVMQWLPPEKNPRASVSIQFYPFSPFTNTTFVKQSQIYKNQVYDAAKNLLSYTYGDNVLQKTTWYCR
jgi:hypothetical protein